MQTDMKVNFFLSYRKEYALINQIMVYISGRLFFEKLNIFSRSS
ncbi:hypothetical protein KOEU_24350 [Komagataeibacter europaeus]|uniref:Uncharacterized protein n=1 Tax=Komagataeibacter europaeus TaxID=33995 RepID=A0A0M0EFP5_KOMEU|nr:hypothetical protein KOEU_24350 [Komagataeibacter europaeus]